MKYLSGKYHLKDSEQYHQESVGFHWKNSDKMANDYFAVFQKV